MALVQKGSVADTSGRDSASALAPALVIGVNGPVPFGAELDGLTICRR